MSVETIPIQDDAIDEDLDTHDDPSLAKYITETLNIDREDLRMLFAERVEKSR